MPVGIAPVGLTGLNWANGEMLGARAAEKFGIPFTLSTMSICSIEDVAGAVTKPFWFQLYVFRDRGFAASLIDRAKAAKCSALMLTLDLQIQGQRHMDLKNGLTVPPRLTPGTLLDVITKPAWALNVMTSRRRSFGNLEGQIKGADNLLTLSQWIAGQFDPTLSWKDIASFTNQVGELAEAEDHHPTILTEWGRVTVTWWTHAIKGLHQNDFIMAAKTDRAYQDIQS